MSVIDATFFSESELPGRDMSKIPHPLVTQTMSALEGLDLEGRGPNGRRVILTHMNHTNPLHGETEEKRLVEDRGFLVAQLGMSWDLS